MKTKTKVKVERKTDKNGENYYTASYGNRLFCKGKTELQAVDKLLNQCRHTDGEIFLAALEDVGEFMMVESQLYWLSLQGITITKKEKGFLVWLKKKLGFLAEMF